MMRANAIEHHVDDFEAEARFFRDVLGCPENVYIPDTVASFKVADNLTVLVLPRDQGHPPYTKLRGETIDISVDLPDVETLYEKLKAKGAAIRQPPMTQPTGIRHFYFETPAGLTIEYERRRRKTALNCSRRSSDKGEGKGLDRCARWRSLARTRIIPGPEIGGAGHNV